MIAKFRVRSLKNLTSIFIRPQRPRKAYLRIQKKMSWDNPLFPIDTKNSIVFLYNFLGVSLDFQVIVCTFASLKREVVSIENLVKQPKRSHFLLTICYIGNNPFSTFSNYIQHKFSKLSKNFCYFKPMVHDKPYLGIFKSRHSFKSAHAFSNGRPL